MRRRKVSPYSRGRKRRSTSIGSFSTWRCPSPHGGRRTSTGQVLGPNLIVDDGGDATLLFHLGIQTEKNPALLDREAAQRGRSSPAGAA